MSTKAELLQLNAKIRMLSQYSGLPGQVLKQRLLALDLDFEAQEDFVTQQLYCYTAKKITEHPDQVLKERALALQAEREEVAAQQRNRNAAKKMKRLTRRLKHASVARVTKGIKVVNDATGRRIKRASRLKSAISYNV